MCGSHIVRTGDLCAVFSCQCNRRSAEAATCVQDLLSWAEPASLDQGVYGVHLGAFFRLDAGAPLPKVNHPLVAIELNDPLRQVGVAGSNWSIPHHLGFRPKAHAFMLLCRSAIVKSSGKNCRIFPRYG